VLIRYQVVNYLLGSLSRIFTTLQEVPDPLILYGFIAGFALNAVLFIQVLYYWNSPATKSAAAKNKKLNKPIASEKNSASTGTSSARVKSPSTRRRG
jgi:mannose-P-dolichol utilization defect protein 1